MSEEFSGKLIADKYRVGDLIREGEAGDLYHGRHEIMDRPVTLKVLPQAVGIDQRWQKRFIDEARAASTVSHPNVLQLNDFGTDQKNISYAVFEHTDGKTLADIESGPALEERRAIDIAKAIAAGVGAAHEKSVIHGQLAPKNIFVDDETVKVYGFGSDKLNVSRDADPRYLAPEQLGKFSAADARSDIYSLGVMLYEMVGGALPYKGDSAADIKAKQENEPPAPLSAFRNDLGSEIEPIILSAMALEPERRYQSMKEFSEDLELLGSRLGAPAADATAGGLKPPAWRTVGLVALGVILLGGVLIYATRTKQTDVTGMLKPDEGSLPVQPVGPATGVQEEALMKMPADMTPEEITAAQNANTASGLGAPPMGPYSSGPLAGSTAGGDTYNPWATGQPPPGAPAYVPPAGARVSGDPNPASPFTGDPNGTTIIRKNVLTGECTDFNTGAPVRCPATNDPNAHVLTPPRGAANANTANPKPTPKTQGAPAANKQPANASAKPTKTPGKPGGDQPE
jgi:hypothetical protein